MLRQQSSHQDVLFEKSDSALPDDLLELQEETTVRGESCEAAAREHAPLTPHAASLARPHLHAEPGSGFNARGSVVDAALKTNSLTQKMTPVF